MKKRDLMQQLKLQDDMLIRMQSQIHINATAYFELSEAVKAGNGALAEYHVFGPHNVKEPEGEHFLFEPWKRLPYMEDSSP